MPTFNNKLQLALVQELIDVGDFHPVLELGIL